MSERRRRQRLQTREARGSEDGSGGRRSRISQRMSSSSGRFAGAGEERGASLISNWGEGLGRERTVLRWSANGKITNPVGNQPAKSRSLGSRAAPTNLRLAGAGTGTGTEIFVGAAGRAPFRIRRQCLLQVAVMGKGRQEKGRPFSHR